MPDTTFETLLSGQLREYAEAGVRPIDHFAIAEETIASGRTLPRWRRGWGSAPVRGNRVLTPLLVGLLLAALAGGALLVAGRLVAPPTHLVPHTYRNEFVALPDLSRPMALPQVVPLVGGRVLVIGNGGEGGDPTVTAELYDPATGTSDPLGPIATPGGFVDQAVRLKDGRVLILADGTAQVFDPTTMRFAPVGPMVNPSRTPAAVLHDGRVLIAGGRAPAPKGVLSALLPAELLDPDTLTFSATGSMGSEAGSLATLPDGRVFVTPNGADDAAQVYDPTTNTFSAAGNLFAPFGVSSAVALPDGRVFLFGTAGAFVNRHLHTEVWDPTSLKFSLAADPPGSVMSATVLDDGRIFLVGGRLNVVQSWAGIYDPATGVTSLTEAPQAWSPTVARLADGRLLLVGGLRDGEMHLDGAVGRDAPAVPTVQVFQ